MKDLFYTLLVAWILWRIFSSVNAHRAKKASQQQTTSKKEGETTVNYVPPKHKMKNPGDVEGDYVDYEEIK